MSRLFLLFCFLLFSMQLHAQKQGQEKIDSLNEMLASFLPADSLDTNRVRVMVELAFEYHRADPDKGLAIGKEALRISESKGWVQGIASASNRIGLCYWAKSNYPKSLEYHFKALSGFEQTGNKKGIATVLGNIGLVYDGQQNYPKALEYHLKSLEINDKHGEKSGVARNLGNIGMAYDAMADYERSLEYYLKALRMYQMLGDRNGIARNLGNIGFVYNEQKNHLKALEYHFRALAMNRELGDKILTGANLGNIGEEYYNIAVDTSAAWLKIRPDSLSRDHVRKASERYLKEAILLFHEIDDLNSLQELYMYLSNLHSLNGHYKESLESYKLHVVTKDSLFSAENRERIGELEKNREEDLQQKEIELLKSQNEVGRLVAQRRMSFTYGLAVAVVILCYAAFMLYRQSRRRERMNVELQQAYIDLKNTQAQLVESERTAAFGRMAARMAHEIQNPLNFVNNLSEVAKELMDEAVSSKNAEEKAELNESIKKNLDAINHHGNRVAEIVSELFRRMREGTTREYFEGGEGADTHFR